MPGVEGYACGAPDEVSMLPSPCVPTRAPPRRGPRDRVSTRAAADVPAAVRRHHRCPRHSRDFRPPADRDLWRDVTPDPQTRAEAMVAVAGAASPLLQHKSFIPLGRHLRPLGPHDRRAIRTAEQEPGFAGNVRPPQPG